MTANRAWRVVGRRRVPASKSGGSAVIAGGCAKPGGRTQRRAGPERRAAAAGRAVARLLGIAVVIVAQVGIIADAALIIEALRAVGFEPVLLALRIKAERNVALAVDPNFMTRRILAERGIEALLRRVSTLWVAKDRSTASNTLNVATSVGKAYLGSRSASNSRSSSLPLSRRRVILIGHVLDRLVVSIAHPLRRRLCHRRGRHRVGAVANRSCSTSGNSSSSAAASRLGQDAVNKRSISSSKLRLFVSQPVLRPASEKRRRRR